MEPAPTGGSRTEPGGAVGSGGEATTTSGGSVGAAGDPVNQGGVVGTGGAAGVGAAAGEAGSPAAGGSGMSVGGTEPTGGIAGAAGVSASLGGTTSAGGTAGAAGSFPNLGGTVGSGGTIGAGGVAGAAGAVGASGALATGGVAGAGAIGPGGGAGAPGAGGAIATGGMAGAAGTPPYQCALGAPEVCDGRDNNCDTQIDEGTSCPQQCSGAEFGGHGYMMCEQRNYTWDEGKTKCEEQGMHLAFLDNQAEHDFAYAWVFASSNSWTWLGGTDVGTEGEWFRYDGTQFWMGGVTGSAVGNAFTAWMSGDPDDDGAGQPQLGDCLAFTLDGWQDEACGSFRRTLCESY